jgi:hypothetical protein
MGTSGTNAIARDPTTIRARRGTAPGESSPAGQRVSTYLRMWLAGHAPRGFTRLATVRGVHDSRPMHPSIIRPSWFTTHGRSLVSCVAIVSTLSYAAWLASLRPEVKTVSVGVPVIVPTPIAVPTPITVRTAIAIPMPIVIPVATPEASSERLPKGADLAASCLIRERTTDIEWSGCEEVEFPAISADGKTLATLFSDGDARVKLRFLSVATGAVIEDIALVSEHDPLDEHQHPTAATRTLISERVSEQQEKLDAGRYRHLMPIPMVDAGSERVAGVSMLYDRNEDANAITILDESTDTKLWSARFIATEHGYPAPVMGDDAGPTCQPATTSTIASWWDPRTRVLLAEVTYVGWACDCTTWAVDDYVHRAP